MLLLLIIVIFVIPVISVISLMSFISMVTIIITVVIRSFMQKIFPGVIIMMMLPYRSPTSTIVHPVPPFIADCVFMIKFTRNTEGTLSLVEFPTQVTSSYPVLTTIPISSTVPPVLHIFNVQACCNIIAQFLEGYLLM